MVETLLNKYAINQVGYYVEDIEKAALEHAAIFGSGPFLYMDAMPMKATYRGKEIEYSIKAAYGQLNGLQIELIQVVDGVDPYAELGQYGFHHFSIWVDDVNEAREIMAKAGYEPAMHMVSGGGLEVYYFDCRKTWGHYIETHAPVHGMWDMVKKASVDWDGTNVFRKFGT